MSEDGKSKIVRSEVARRQPNYVNQQTQRRLLFLLPGADQSPEKYTEKELSGNKSEFSIEEKGLVSTTCVSGWGVSNQTHPLTQVVLTQ